MLCPCLVTFRLTSRRHEATPEIWQETFLSALLRAILYSDDSTYWLEAYRKLDPITNPEGELRFLQAAEILFMKGEFSCFSRVIPWIGYRLWLAKHSA